MTSLSLEQLRRFHDDGYLVVDDVIDPEAVLTPILSEYDELLDGIARRLFAAGRIPSLFEDLPFTDRMTEISEHSGEDFSREFDFSLPQSNVKRDTPVFTGPSVFGLLTDSRLLDTIESVIGPEIYSCPVQHIRIKMPERAINNPANGLVGKVGWHQDIGVLLPEADESTVLTVWIPLNEATVANGCLQVIPRSHQPGRLFDHCPDVVSGALSIPDRLLPPGDPVPLPMRPGSVLLMTQSTVHSSLDNVTPDQVRVSCDLRFQPVGQPTGRPAFESAGFVARSNEQPDSVLRDPAIWASQWHRLRDDLAAAADPVHNRWDSSSPACA